MASQSEANVQDEFKACVAILEELRKFAHVNSSGSLSNYVAREQTALQVTPGDYSVASRSSLRSNIRSRLASAIENGNLRDIFDPLWRNYARVVGTIDENLPIDGVGGILDLIKRRAATPTVITVNSRNINFGSIAAGSNLGSGTILRLTEDEFGYPLEACHMETKRFECIADELINGAEKHREVFRARGATRLIDQLQITGSGWDSELTCQASLDSLIANPTFSDYSGDSITALTELIGWTPSAIANFELDEATVYRSGGGLSDTTPRSLKFLGNGNVSQNLDINNVKVRDNVPIYVQVAFNRSAGSCDGVLTLTYGTESVSVILTSQSGWTILKLPLTKGLYPRNWGDTQDPVIKLTLAGRTTGTLLVDDIVQVPMTPIDGLWYIGVGGATPFVAGNRDTFTVVDALTGAEGILQYWWWRVYGFSHPSNNAGAETWADPTV